MNKYGIEHFHIEELEKIDDESLLSEREIYWIEFKRSFKEGYNATKGGDGKPYIDYDLAVKTYQQTQNISDTAKIIGCDRKTLERFFIRNHIDHLDGGAVSQNKMGKIIGQFDKLGNLITTYPSIKAGARAIGKPSGYTHISDCINGKRKTAYGFQWREI